METVGSLILVLCTLAGGIWALVAFSRWLGQRMRRPALPVYSPEHLRRSLKILAVDDNLFTYSADFERDGYQIEQWNRVDSFGSIEGYDYDLLILDIRGIASHLSERDGLGVAQHVRSSMEAMPVIIYSSSTYQISIDRSAADVAVDVVGSDYQRFKDLVDGFFVAMTSPAFYLRNFDGAHGSPVDNDDVMRLEREVEAVLVDPKSAAHGKVYSSHETTSRATQIVRHASAVSRRLHA